MFSSQPIAKSVACDYSQVTPFDLNRMIRVAAVQYKEYQQKRGLKMEFREIFKLDLIMQTPQLPHTHYDLKFFKNKILHDHMARFLAEHKVLIFLSDDPETFDKYFFIFKGKLDNAKIDSRDEVDFLIKLGIALSVDLTKFVTMADKKDDQPRVSFK